MLPIKNVFFQKGDFTDPKIQNNIMSFFNTKIDILVSDMASNTTGNKDLDSIKTGNLCLNALEFSCKILKSKGVFVSKFFMGSIFQDIKNEAKRVFEDVIFYKPKSSRQESKEIYVYCKKLRTQNV